MKDQVKMRDLCWVQLFLLFHRFFSYEKNISCAFHKKHTCFSQKVHVFFMKSIWKAHTFHALFMCFLKDHLQGIVTLCYLLFGVRDHVIKEEYINQHSKHAIRRTMNKNNIVVVLNWKYPSGTLPRTHIRGFFPILIKLKDSTVDKLKILIKIVSLSNSFF